MLQQEKVRILEWEGAPSFVMWIINEGLIFFDDTKHIDKIQYYGIIVKRKKISKMSIG